MFRFFILFFICCFFYECSRIRIVEDVWDEGQVCFKVITPSATYLYQKNAGGFSSILDKEGNDWISFHPDSTESYPKSAAGSYRGLPNLVYLGDDSGAGHPGFDKCISEKIGDTQIRSHTRSGKWQWTWSFYNSHALLKVDKTDPEEAYWFLYEGPIGGNYDPQYEFWGTDRGGPFKIMPDYYFGNIQSQLCKWIYFGDENNKWVFFILQKDRDEKNDIFSYLGSTDQGVIAPDGMVVAGFGRDPEAKPLLKGSSEFIIGFMKKDNGNLQKTISAGLNKLNY